MIFNNFFSLNDLTVFHIHMCFLRSINFYPTMNSYSLTFSNESHSKVLLLFVKIVFHHQKDNQMKIKFSFIHKLFIQYCRCLFLFKLLKLIIFYEYQYIPFVRPRSICWHNLKMQNNCCFLCSCLIKCECPLE